MALDVWSLPRAFFRKTELMKARKGQKHLRPDINHAAAASPQSEKKILFLVVSIELIFSKITSRFSLFRDENDFLTSSCR